MSEDSEIPQLELDRIKDALALLGVHACSCLLYTSGRIDNILPVLDPTIRTAKVRLEVANPGMMRVGMFVTATFYGKQREIRAAVPAAAILHLHDREWVYAPIGAGHFKRLEVVTGNMLPGNGQEVVSGIKPGDQVVSNALALQNTVEQ